MPQWKEVVSNLDNKRDYEHQMMKQTSKNVGSHAENFGTDKP